MTCLNCMSGPGEEARVCIEDGDTEREITLPLCEECYHDFNETVGVVVSRTQSVDERTRD